MKLSEFWQDSRRRSRGRLRENSLRDYDSTMKHFTNIIGDIDYRHVHMGHGERFVQACLDRGNSRATVKKKLATIKCLFQLAVERGQLEDNPFRYIRPPKVTQRKINIFTDDECMRLVKAGRELFSTAKLRRGPQPINWPLLILTALCTGMRRGELLNTTWRDIDFDNKSIDVDPKRNGEHTWEWNIKDTDRRTVPLTDEVVALLAEHQAEQKPGYPYVFVPPHRYDYIQEVRQQGKWSARKGNDSLNNFRRQFLNILGIAGLEQGEFHDLRRTCLTNWFANGLSEYEVMTMAGHASFETTRRFYLAIRSDVVDRARAASSEAMKGISVARWLRAPLGEHN